MNMPDALDLAIQQELDLVEVSPNAEPPVCRILDYGKLRYLHAKKMKDSRKSQKSQNLREVRFRPNIGRHDLEAKTRKVKELLNEGAKVKVGVFFRGREVTHPELGMTLLKQVAEDVKEGGRLDRPPTMEGRSITIILTPMSQSSEKKPAEVGNA